VISHWLSLTAFASGLLALVLTLRFTSEGHGRMSPKGRVIVVVAMLISLACVAARALVGPR